MTTSALIMMITAQGIIIGATLYFFKKVLAKPIAKHDHHEPDA